MGKRFALVLIFSLLLAPLSLKAETAYAAENAMIVAELESKDKPIPSALLVDPRFPEMIELAIQPKDHVFQNAKNKMVKKQYHPAVKERLIRKMKNFRHRLRTQALQVAKDMQLNLTPQQEDDFIRSYWLRRAEIEKTVYQEMEPRRNELLEKAKQDFKTQFSQPTTVKK